MHTKEKSSQVKNDNAIYSNCMTLYHHCGVHATRKDTSFSEKLFFSDTFNLTFIRNWMLEIRNPQFEILISQSAIRNSHSVI